VSDSIRPFPDPISSVLSRFPAYLAVSLSGGSDFIRSSESVFPALREVDPGHEVYRVPVQAEP
ncbi:hypothetical protein P1S61_40025, partial [Streptomyces sp. ME08-AFT2]|uniref:hypothetical protein n=1 Tax=Streptomyces sp. ME08-AFT2 TaxID=3028683 RepID=UPI0029B5D2FD